MRLYIGAPLRTLTNRGFRDTEKEKAKFSEPQPLTLSRKPIELYSQTPTPQLARRLIMVSYRLGAITFLPSIKQKSQSMVESEDNQETGRGSKQIPAHVVNFLSKLRISQAQKNQPNQLNEDPNCKTPIPDENYDLSFAYSFQWEEPGRQIKEALKVLLNREGENQTEDSAVKVKKRGTQNPSGEKQLNSAALEAARIRYLLAINPNTPPPVLEHLTRNAPTSLLERIAENPRTHSTTLARLASHEDFEVRAAVADNLNTSIKTIWKLARDTHADVRFRVAECYSVPLVVLKVLAEDENPHVAFRAQKTVWRILKEVTELRTA